MELVISIISKSEIREKRKIITKQISHWQYLHRRTEYFILYNDGCKYKINVIRTFLKNVRGTWTIFERYKIELIFSFLLFYCSV